MNNHPILDWLLESDPDHAGVRFFTLRDLLELPTGDPRLVSAQAEVMQSGPVPAILAHQQTDGSWDQPGIGPYHKYLGSHWQVHILACLGSGPEDERIRMAGENILSQSLSPAGSFAYYRPPVPSGAILCINGNLTDALIQFGFASDPRLLGAVEWMACAVTGEGALQYYKSGTSGPGFACAANMGQPCAWGAIKVLRALTSLPEERRTPMVRQALDIGAEFLLSRDPAAADYSYTERVSSTWFKLGFPLSYWADVLELADVLARLGYGQDPRTERLWQLLLDKRNPSGRWVLENGLNGKMYVDIDQKGQPSKWITLRALRAFKQAGRLDQALDRPA